MCGRGGYDVREFLLDMRAILFFFSRAIMVRPAKQCKMCGRGGYDVREYLLDMRAILYFHSRTIMVQ